MVKADLARQIPPLHVVPKSASQNDRLTDELIYRERQHDLLAFGPTLAQRRRH
jgi:hypothetical protein